MLTYLIDAMLPFFRQGPKTFAPLAAEDLIEYARVALGTGGPSGIRFRRLADDLISTDHPEVATWLSSLFEKGHPACSHPFMWWLCFRRSLRNYEVVQFAFA